MTDRERLRELAEKATPGPWWTGLGGQNVYGAWRHKGRQPADAELVGEAATFDAAYIAAASPDVILVLLADLEAAEERVRVLEAALAGVIADHFDDGHAREDCVNAAWHDATAALAATEDRPAYTVNVKYETSDPRG